MFKEFISGIEQFRVDKPGISAGSRVTSVDTLRGFDMFWIIGGEAIFKSLDKIFHSPATGFISSQLNHVKWTGFGFYDLIMPLFLFIVGVSMPFSYRRRLEKNPSKSVLWPHIIKRVIILWILGMAVQGNLFDWDWSRVKFYSNTLQAIASGYLIASVLILYFKVSWQLIGTVILMLIYWALLTFVPVPGFGAGVITQDGNFAIYIDKLLLGSFQDGTTYSWIISSLNFGATTMIGVFTGYLLQSDSKSIKKIIYLISAGIVLIVFSRIWNIWHPSVKHIWTSSFVLFSGGICLFSVALFVLLVDHLKLTKGFTFFTVIGMNAIFAYCAAHLFDFRQIGNVVLGGLEKYTGNWFGLISALGGFGVLYFILWQMYKRKIFIKI
jgi:predicted acyltransferase